MVVVNFNDKKNGEEYARRNVREGNEMFKETIEKINVVSDDAKNINASSIVSSLAIFGMGFIVGRRSGIKYVAKALSAAYHKYLDDSDI